MFKILNYLFLSVFILCAGSSLLHAQNENMTMKNLEFKNATLEECVKEISRLAGCGYLAKGEDLGKIKGITRSYKSVRLGDLLKDLLSSYGYAHTCSNGVILVYKGSYDIPGGLSMDNGKARESSTTLRIKVVDSKNGEPVFGATCHAKNVGSYAMTDENGFAILDKLPCGVIEHEVIMLGYEAFSQERELYSPLDMTSAEKITIRTLNTYNSNNSFGTSIMVDGVPISDNASLADKTGINTTGGTGVDLRQIGADNIESVEVIRGIPSAEYGDLSAGAVIVNTKAGYTPYEIRAKINPTTFNTSFGKGWKFDSKKGSLNVNLDYAQAWGDPRNKSQAFDRVSGGVTYTNTIGSIWYTNTKINFSSIVDTRKSDPDLIAEGSETSQS